MLQSVKLKFTAILLRKMPVDVPCVQRTSFMDTQARLPIHAKRIIIGAIVRNAEDRFSYKVFIIKRVRLFFLVFHRVHSKPKIIQFDWAVWMYGTRVDYCGLRC